jgi:hypothetical protein
MGTDNEARPKDHELGHFLRVANDSCNTALETLKEPVRFLADVDSLYMDFIPEMGGIKPATASILLLNAHASFRAAIRLALSGQLLPVFMTLRGSVESALYANAMAIKPELQDVWLKRGSDEKGRQACRDEFTVGKMFQYLEKAHNKEFSESVRTIYDSTIDFGAHPNNHLLIRSVRIEALVTGERALDFAYIHGSGSFELRQSLVACAEIGLSVFLVALICFSKHPRLNSLNARALELQAKVPKLIEQLGLHRHE